jgi:dephospho-CoA kinase
MGIKPSDRWTISLCKECHQVQHLTGEETFAKEHGINLKQLAEEFFRNSPHRHKLETKEGD